MATYTYTALDEVGQEQKGIIEASNRREAITLLRGQNLFPTKIRLIKGQEVYESNAPAANLETASPGQPASATDKNLMFPENHFRCKYKGNLGVTSGYINILGEHGKVWLIFDCKKSTYGPTEQVRIEIDEICEVRRKGFFRPSLVVSTHDSRTFHFTGNIRKIADIIYFEIECCRRKK